MRYEVFDHNDPEDPGVDLVFDFENGMAITIFMDDGAAQQLIDVIQNKLNARIP